MFIAGLTGNFGMGKSYVLSVFKSLGAITMDSDGIVDQLLKDGKVINEIKNLVGNRVIDGDGLPDRKYIADKIFSNKWLREQVEALLHPLVFKKIDSFIDRIKDKDKDRLVVIEVPLLFEGGYRDRFSRVITVYTTQRTAIERLKDKGISRNEALRRLKIQMPIKIKKKLADYLIDNNGPKQRTRKQVEMIYGSLIQEMRGQQAS
ncbi:MAG: dephospho-CoA kinase [Nitrospirota bacterium]|nr:dephospho-CoA kinase [Nitrospirota bacterium]